MRQPELIIRNWRKICAMRLMAAVVALVVVVAACGNVTRPINGPHQFSVVATLQVKPGGPVLICYPARLLPLLAPKCGGIPLKGLTTTHLVRTTTYSDGSFETTPLKLTGTWDGSALTLADQPSAAPGISPGFTTLWATKVTKTDEVSGGRATADGLADQARLMDSAPQLRDKGILIYEHGFDGIGYYIRVVAGDGNTATYLRDNFDASTVESWMAPIP